jgi:Fe-S cluster assembly protein SufD
MIVTLMKTEAEEALARQFAAVASSLPGTGDAPARRAAAMDRFRETGLPHRRIEEFKYSDVRSALKTAFAPADVQAPIVDANAIEAALGPVASLDADRLVFVDGAFVQSLSSSEIAGVTFRRFATGQPTDDAAFSAIAGANPLLALNEAFASDGAVISVDGARKLAGRPLVILYLHTAREPRRVTTRNLIEVAANARIDLVEVHARIGTAAVQTSTATRLVAGDGAEVAHIKIDREISAATHLSLWDLELGAATVYRGFQLTAGAGFVRNDIVARLPGADAKFDVSGLMLGRGDDHVDTTLVVDHIATGCESRELFKAVLDDRARAVFQGKVIVAPEAQKTDGKQMSQALLLADDVEFYSKPELEIYADDVACGHGATAAELDESMLFYLRSRGIGLAEARSLLIESFALETLEKIENDDIRAVARSVVITWLGADL